MRALISLTFAALCCPLALMALKCMDSSKNAVVECPLELGFCVSEQEGQKVTKRCGADEQCYNVSLGTGQGCFITGDKKMCCCKEDNCNEKEIAKDTKIGEVEDNKAHHDAAHDASDAKNPAVVAPAKPVAVHTPTAVAQIQPAAAHAPTVMASAPATVLHSPPAVLKTSNAVANGPAAVPHTPDTALHSSAINEHSPAAFAHNPAAVPHTPGTVLHSPAAVAHGPAVAPHNQTAISHIPGAAVHTPIMVVNASASVTPTSAKVGSPTSRKPLIAVHPSKAQQVLTSNATVNLDIDKEANRTVSSVGNTTNTNTTTSAPAKKRSPALLDAKTFVLIFVSISVLKFFEI